MRLYLAGPEVFLPHAADLGARKKTLCRAHGFEGLYPLDGSPGPRAGERPDHAIYRNNIAMIQAADGGIFNLTPFRGPSADVGTVFELGMMAGLGKPVFGYTNTAADLRARVFGAERKAACAWIDADGYAVEDFGNADNLMIDACLALGRNAMLRAARDAPLDCLELFERCLAIAAARLAAQIVSA